MGCACVVALFAGFPPRLAFLFLWLFTPLVSEAFDSLIWPFLGLCFLPYTSIACALAYSPTEGISRWGWLVILVGFVFDVAAATASVRTKREPAPPAPVEG